MAKKRAKRTSRKKQPIRLLNVAQGIVVGNAITSGLFQSNLYEFTTGRKDGAYRPGSDGQSFVTLPELLGFANSPFGLGRTATNTLGDVVMNNLKRPGVAGSMVLTLVLAKPAFKLGKRAMGGIIRPINKQLKGTGVAL
jgi:hypothetical protein